MQNDLSIEHSVERHSALARWRGLTIATSAKPRRPGFDGVTIFLHWATALFVLGMFVTAWLHAWAEAQESASAAILIQIHRSMGATVWVATVARLVWRLTCATLPPFPVGMTRAHRAVVQASEYALYAWLLVQPATGLGATLFNGRAFALFMWRIPQLLPQDKAIATAFHSLHELGAWTLGLLAGVHAAAALFHHFALGDDTLARMAPAISAADRTSSLPGRTGDGSINGAMRVPNR